MKARTLSLAILYGVALVWGGYNLGRAAFGPKLGEDYRAYFVASRMVLEGRADLVLGDQAVYAERAVAYGVPLIAAGEEQIPVLASPYPPPVALAFAPFARLGFRASLLVFTLLNVAASALAVFLLFADEPNRERRRFLVAIGLGLSLLYFPHAYSLYMGQMNGLLLGLCVLTLHLARRGRDLAAGGALALAIAFKIFPAILVLFFLLERRAKVVIAAACGVAAIVVASLPWFPLSAYADYATRILPESYAGGTWPRNQGLPGVLARLLTPNPYVSPIADAPALVRPLTILGSLAVLAALVAASRRRSAPESRRFAIVFSLFLVAALILLSKSWEHYGIFLLPAFLLIGAECVERAGCEPRGADAGAGDAPGSGGALGAGRFSARLFLLAASFSVWAFVLASGEEYRALPSAVFAQPLFAAKFAATTTLFLVGLSVLRDARGDAGRTG